VPLHIFVRLTDNPAPPLRFYTHSGVAVVLAGVEFAVAWIEASSGTGNGVPIRDAVMQL